MKRSLHFKAVAMIGAVMVLPLTACGSGSAERKPQDAETTSWPQPPSVTEVVWNGNLAGVSGVAAPSARVVFSGEAGEAYAVTADDEGQFLLWIEVPQGGLMLHPRIQIGQTGVEGQGVMFLASHPKPVVAILFAGEGAYRLDGNRPLDAVDSDGEAMIVTGRFAPGHRTHILVGGQSIPVTANEDGRWAVVTTTGPGPVDMVLDGVPYRFAGTGSASDVVSHTESGWTIRREWREGAVQTTWLPEGK